MENKRLDWLKAHIGQSTKMSPSPFAHWLNGTLEEAEFGKIAVRFAVRPDMTNPLGLLHGGVIAGMLDDVIGTAVATLGKEQAFVSINLSVDFLQAAKVTDEVLARAEVTRNGRTVVYLKAELLHHNNSLLALASSHMVAVPKK